MSAAARVFAGLAAVLVALAALVGASAQDAPATFPWISDLDEARARAKLEGKPVLAVFRCFP